MFSIALVVFREVFEVSLILGILMAATPGVAKRTQWVWVGILGGIVGSIIIAIFADIISQAMEGMGQEILNATILLIAAALIGWTVLWMTRHGRMLSQEFRQIGQHVVCGYKPIHTLAMVVALAVLREGAEIVMFTYSSYVTGTAVGHLVLGGLLGMSAGAVMGMMIYYGLMKVPTKQIFLVTSWLLILLVAGMVAQAFGFLTAAGRVPEIIPIVWDSSSLIAENSFLGKIMHVLMGYTDKPSGIQLLMYFLTIGGLVVALKTYGQGGIQQMKKSVVVAVVGIACVIANPQAAHATKKVYSPIVEKGEIEIEARGEYNIDERDDKDDTQKQKYALGYGVTDRWFTELYGELERTKNDDDEDLDFMFTSLAWENRFQLTEQGQFPVDIGAYLEYETSFEDKHPDNLEAKLLLEKSWDKFTHTVNITLEQNIGRHPTEDLVGGFAYSGKYRLKPWFEPGVEWHSDLGELGQNVSFQDQEHQMGPVFYGKIGKIKYDVGYLFGMSDAAPKGEIKWIAEYEFRF